MNYTKIAVSINSDKRPSPFIGSALRGSFGHALKEKSCINPTYRCDGCFAKEQCLYATFYEQSSGYRPFRFEIESEQQNYDFGLILFFQERREKDISLILEALSLMLTQNGLEQRRYRFKDHRFRVESHTFSKEIYAPPVGTVVYIKSLTPLILKQANRKLIQEITLEDIVRSLYKRWAFFEEGKVHAKLPFVPTYELIRTKYQHQKSLRRSDGQGKKIVVEGYHIELVVKNLDVASYQLLKYGEVLATGNDTVRGYGRLVVELGF